MTVRSRVTSARALGVASFALVALVAGESQAQRAGGGTFAAMAGSWSGTGTITLANGGNERIRCRSTNTVAGTGESAQLTLRCASDSYRFDLNSNVTAQGGALSGTWSETTRNVSGNVSGSATAGDVRAQVSAQGFAANLYMSTKGNQQSVSISSAGTELSRVTLTMTKGGA